MKRLAFVLLTCVAAPSLSAADTPPIIDSGDTVWVVLCAALVLLMTIPGLSLFYGGLVRRRNVMGTMMQSLAITALMSVLWAVVGFGLAFGDAGPICGGLRYILLDGVAWSSTVIPAANPDYSATVPFGAFFLYQMMFAVITPAVICGAYAERMKFSSMLAFSTLWLFVVYIPLAHMVWGKNGLMNWSFGATSWAVFDFAGGTVVETASGITGLVCAIFLGPRRQYLKEPMPPHNLTMAFTGTCLLWFGWFGFNGGGTLAANGLAVLTCINTHLAACAATLAWPLCEWLVRGKPTALGACSGAVAGLVAITPACGFVTPSGALLIGSIAGVLSFWACGWLKLRCKYDDALDVFGVHGVAGIWGTVATGLFFARDVNPAVKTSCGALYDRIGSDGRWPVVLGQLQAVGITILLAAIGSAAILALLKIVMGLRVSEEEETVGLDLTQHDEKGYHEFS